MHARHLSHDVPTGQTISIRLLPPHVARAAGPGAPRQQDPDTGASLLARMSGNSTAASAPPNRSGPVRGVRGGRGLIGFARMPEMTLTSGDSGPRGRGGAANRGPRGPASAGDLDKELDTFMTSTGVSVSPIGLDGVPLTFRIEAGRRGNVMMNSAVLAVCDLILQEVWKVLRRPCAVARMSGRHVKLAEICREQSHLCVIAPCRNHNTSIMS